MKSRIFSCLAVGFGLTAWLLAQGCVAEDEDGSGPADVTDLGSRDAGIDSSGFDVAEDPEVGVDTGSDSGTPDYVPPVCGGLGQMCCEGATCDGSLECAEGICEQPSTTNCPGTPACFSPTPGSPDVPIEQAAGLPPTLAGGSLVAGEYELTRIDLYMDDTFSDLVTSVVVESNGNTYGSLKIEGADWGFDANLDLYMVVNVLGMEFPQELVQGIEAGGCFTVSGNQIEGDLTECGGYWPEGVTPPSSLAFESVTGGLELLLVLPNAAIMASVPEEYQSYAALAITGDLPIVFTFDRD